MTNQLEIRILFTILLSLFFINSASALDVQGYEEKKISSLQYLKVHICGVGYGFSWGNTILEERGDKAFYCPPSKIALNDDNYMEIIDVKIAEYKNSRMKEIPVELMLYFGLVDTFPCPE